jgi:hypothetical protein
MRETVGASGAVIGRLQEQIEGLVDADVLLLEDGEWLMATLERTLQGLAAADLRVSRSGVQGFIERLEGLVESGELDALDGQPPVDLARGVLASLHGQEESVVAAGTLSRFRAAGTARDSERG